MKLTAFTKKDFETVYDFMRPLWLETYGAILPKQQIEFLLNQYFSLEALDCFRAKGYQYRKIDDVGVLVFVERETEVYIDKLYLLPSARGKGYPPQIFNELLTLGKDLVLNVNQGNERAVHCYQKNGFIIDEKIAIQLGHGMVNYDFVMRKRV